jgi:hypothetical protein
MAVFTKSAAQAFGEKIALKWEGENSLASYFNNSMAEIPREAVGPMRVGGIVSSMILGAVLNHKLNKELKKLKKANPQQIKKILHHFQLKDMPAVEYPRLDNAAYIEPSSFQKGWFSEGLHQEDPRLRKTVASNPELVEKMRRHGLVIYDKNFATPAIIAHEAGHADIGNMPWYAPSNINQRYLRPLTGFVGNIAAPLVGIAAGAATRNPFLGLGAGALTGAAIHAPTLLNEWQATHRAKKYLDQKMLSREELDKSKHSLNTAFNTYLASAAVAPAIVGAVAGGFANGASPRDIFGRLKSTTA